MRVGVVSLICNTHSGSRAPIELAIALSKIGLKVSFFSFETNKDLSTVSLLEKAKVSLKLISKSRVPIIGAIIDSFNFYNELKNTPLDIITTHTTLSLLIGAKLTGKKILACYYGTQFNILRERFLGNNFLITFFDLILNKLIFIKSLLLLTLSTRVVSISKYCQNEAKLLYGIKSEVIYLGAVPDNFITKGIKRKKEIVLLSVSRITPYKQFDLLIKVFNEIKRVNLKFIIAGSSPQRRYLQHLQMIKNSNTEILINPSDKKLNSIYQTADIYLSGDKYLFFGMPILEAASFSIPVVSLNYAAANEVITNGKSGVVENKLGGFKKSLEKLIDSPRLRAKMGQAAKQQAQKFKWEYTAKNYQKIFSQMIAK
ncbi:glycosyltransferase family 4 protein [Candidatus Daviesbacteria bacterium]|nr:glycosyltransferase family 4 protein [Candidatus Daviesbacteria bacterium]